MVDSSSLFRIFCIAWLLVSTACDQQQPDRSEQFAWSIQPAQIEPLPHAYNQWATDRLQVHGSIRSLEVRHYSARIKNGEPIKRPLRTGSVIYQHEEAIFNRDGRLIESTLYSSQADTAVLHQLVSYTDSGIIREIKTERAGRSALVTRYDLGEHGNLVRSIRTEEGSDYEYREQFYEDSLMHAVLVLTHTGKRLLARRQYKLDDHNRLLRYRYFNPPDRDTANYEIHFVYDDRGKVLTESAFDENGMRLHHIRYAYNKKGYCSKAMAYQANDELTGEEEYDYEWDQQGNWIRRVTSIRGQPWIITERTITYY